MFKYRTTPLVIIIWIGAIWLLRLDVVSQSFLAKDAYIDINDGALIMRQDYLGMYLGNEKAGFSRFILKEDSAEDAQVLPGKYYIYYSDMFMRVTVMGISMDLNMNQSGEVNEDLSLRSFRFQYRASGQDMYVRGTVNQGTLELTSKSEGYSATKAIEIPSKIYPVDALHLVMAQEGITVGEKKSYPVFEPSMATLGTVHVEVVSEEKLKLPEGGTVNAFKIDTEFQGLHQDIWIDKDGNIYKQSAAIAGIQFTSVRETEEQAKDLSFIANDVREMAPVAQNMQDLLDASKIIPNTPLKNPSAVSELKVKIYGANTDQIVLDDTKQVKLAENNSFITVQINKLDYSGLSTGTEAATLPFENDVMLRPYLGEDLFIQTMHPDIKAKALEVAAGAKSPWEASRKIADWLYKNIAKEIRGTIPSSIEVLRTMKGDCNEHSTLFTAMARAVGIPTKLVAGLVYQDDGFYYHAWNEVYIDGQWYPLDATLNRIEMDAAHIKLAEGSLDQQSGIATIMGKVDIEIIDYK
jgi:hypothetical protein